MKKIISMFLTVAVAGVLLAGCAKSEEGDTANPAAPKKDGKMDEKKPDAGKMDEKKPDAAPADAGKMDEKKPDAAPADAGKMDEKKPDAAPAPADKK